MTARVQSPLQCVHCHTTETPLWRAGPSGPKTLCNACGVRWKKTGSVIPRAKRAPSSSPSTINKTSSGVRKRPRVNADNHHSPSNNHNNTTANNAPSVTTTPSKNEVAHQQQQHVDNHQQVKQQQDPAARVAAASMPAPRPISVFRVSDAQRSKYESIFSGLMVVPRLNSNSLSKLPSNNQVHHHHHQQQQHQKEKEKHQIDFGGTAENTRRARTQTAKASAFFSDLSHQKDSVNNNTSNNSYNLPPPSPSPPPIDLSLANSVYVTEIHAPSPSPSPPPMPRKRLAEGGGFRLVLASMADDRTD